MENQKLFIGNLKFETEKEEIVALVSEYGAVSSISLRPNKGFAFVEMSKSEEAMAVITNLDQSTFKERPLRISLALPKKKAKTVTRERYKQLSKKQAKKKK